MFKIKKDYSSYIVTHECKSCFKVYYTKPECCSNCGSEELEKTIGRIEYIYYGFLWLKIKTEFIKLSEEVPTHYNCRTYLKKIRKRKKL